MFDLASKKEKTSVRKPQQRREKKLSSVVDDSEYDYGTDYVEPKKPAVPSIGPEMGFKLTQDQRDALTGFARVPEDDWQKIQKGDFLKYIRKRDGKLTRGGFVLARQADQKGSKCLVMIGRLDIPEDSDRNPKWVVLFESIAAIWKRVGGDNSGIVISSFATVHEDMKKMEERLRFLESRNQDLTLNVTRLTTELRQVMVFLKTQTDKGALTRLTSPQKKIENPT